MTCLMPTHPKNRKPSKKTTRPDRPATAFHHDHTHRAVYSDIARMFIEGRLSEEDADVARHQADIAAEARNHAERVTATEILYRHAEEVREHFDAGPRRHQTLDGPWNERMQRHEARAAHRQEMEMLQKQAANEIRDYYMAPPPDHPAMRNPKPTPPVIVLDTPGKRSIILPP